MKADALFPVSRPLPRARAAATSALRSIGVPPLLVILLAVGLMCWNLFGFPLFKEDEGQNLSWAMSILHGRLLPSQYDYQHPPAAAMQIAAWMALVGDVRWLLPPLQSLTSVESARLAMVAVAAIQALLVFTAVRHLTGRPWAGFVAALLLITSPLELYFGRWVQLDAFTGMWLTAAVVCCLRPARPTHPLPRVAAGGLCFGLALLSKEVALVALPALILLCIDWPAGERRMAVGAFLGAAAILPALYLAAVLAAGQFLPGNGPSFIGGLQWQSSRLHDAGILDLNSQFYQVLGTWFQLQPLLVVAVILGCAWLTACAGTWRRRAIGVLGVCFWAFFASGRIVQDYYVAGAIGIWAMVVVVAAVDAIERIVRKHPGVLHEKRAGLITTLSVLAALYFLTTLPAYHRVFATPAARSQVQLVRWLRMNVPPDAAVIDDGADGVDLRQADWLPGRQITDACNYWNTWCWHASACHAWDVWCLQGGSQQAYVVVTGELDYLAKIDPEHFAALAALARSGKTVWRADTPTNGSYIHVQLVGDASGT